ncbi:TPA_asm: UL27.5 sORF [Human alphaherpesvirus 1]|nr:TPA_asm: UL27.5 sORF [Human alphaherpesvirus 1]
MQFTVVPYRWNASTREGLYLRSVVCQPRLVRVAALAGFSSMSVSWSSR